MHCFVFNVIVCTLFIQFYDVEHTIFSQHFSTLAGYIVYNTMIYRISEKEKNAYYVGIIIGRNY